METVFPPSKKKEGGGGEGNATFMNQSKLNIPMITSKEPKLGKGE